MAGEALAQAKGRQVQRQINVCPFGFLGFLNNIYFLQVGSSAARKAGKAGSLVMTSEDVAAALGEQGVTVRRAPYFQ